MLTNCFRLRRALLLVAYHPRFRLCPGQSSRLQTFPDFRLFGLLGVLSLDRSLERGVSVLSVLRESAVLIDVSRRRCHFRGVAIFAAVHCFRRGTRMSVYSNLAFQLCNFFPRLKWPRAFNLGRVTILRGNNEHSSLPNVSSVKQLIFTTELNDSR